MAFASPSSDIVNAVTNAAATYGVDPALLYAIGNTESGLNPNAAKGGAGEIGTFQILPSTAVGLGYSLDPSSSNYIGTLQNNANAAASYIANLEKTWGTNLTNVIAAYNEGSGALTAHGIYKTTQAYVQNVLAAYNHYANNNVGSGTTSVGVTGTGTVASNTGVSGKVTPNINVYNPSDPFGFYSGPTSQAAQNLSSITPNFITDTVKGITQNLLLSGLALALVAGGFTLLAAGNPQVRTAAKSALE